jgi:hypothetical protein
MSKQVQGSRTVRCSQNCSGLQLQGVLVPGQTKRRYWNTVGASRRSWVQVADSLWVSQVIDIDYVLKVLNEANSWGFHGLLEKQEYFLSNCFCPAIIGKN